MILKGEKRIRRIHEDIGRQVVGRAWENLKDKRRKEVSKKEFNSIVGRTLRFDSSDAKQILSVLNSNGKVRVTSRRIKLLRP